MEKHSHLPKTAILATTMLGGQVLDCERLNRYSMAQRTGFKTPVAHLAFKEGTGCSDP